jgi:hypothetical protein
MIRTTVAHLRAQWMGALALFLVIAGGTAYASNTVFSTDIVDGEVRAADIGTGEVLSTDLRNNQIRSADVRDDTSPNGGLTGADIKDQSGVDTCTHSTVRYGELCVVSDTTVRSWSDALNHCGGLELRLPSIGEAVALAKNYDVPDVDAGQHFWSDHLSLAASGTAAIDVDEDGSVAFSAVTNQSQTVCVTTPTN